jgi:hypothetical protein
MSEVRPPPARDRGVVWRLTRWRGTCGRVGSDAGASRQKKRKKEEEETKENTEVGQSSGENPEP